MPEAIVVTGSGAGSVTLSSYKVMAYVPKTGNVDAESVEESIKLYFPSVAAASTAMGTLEQIFSQARRYRDTGEGPRIYVEFTEPGGDPWISYLLDGRVEWDDDILKPWYKAAGYGKAVVFWSREPKWYKLVEESIPLSNVNGTNQTNGLEIDNRDDTSGHSAGAGDNYVRIDGDDVEGNLPTPAKIWFTNTTAGVTIDKLLIGHHVFDGSSVAGLSHVFEGESASADAMTLTDAGDTACSSGNYTTISTGSYGTELRACYWLVTSTDQLQWAGKEYRIIARLRSLPAASIYARIKVQAIGASSDYIWEGEQVLLDVDSQLQELALLRLPPDRLLASLDPTQIHLALYLTLPTGEDLELDYIAFVPLSSYRQFDQWPLGLAEDDAIVDDGFEQETYVYDASANQYRGYPPPLGAPLMLVPGKDQRVYALWSNGSGVALPAYTADLAIYYHPCKRTPLS